MWNKLKLNKQRYQKQYERGNLIMSFLKNRKAICLLTTVFVFLSIFSTGFAQTSKAEAPATLRIGWSVEADSLSPFISYTQAGAEVFYLIYDSLVKFDEEFNPV